MWFVEEVSVGAVDGMLDALGYAMCDLGKGLDCGVVGSEALGWVRVALVPSLLDLVKAQGYIILVALSGLGVLLLGE